MGVVKEQVSEAGVAFANVFRNPGLRRINLALAGSVVGDWAYGIAVSIWAYQQGGTTALGIFGVVRFVLLAVASPVASALADRYPKKIVMIGSDLARIVLVLAGAFLVATEGPALLVYGVALSASIVSTAFRPAQASLIPTLARDPEQLTGANVVASTIESVGFFVGPAIGGLLLAFADIPVVFLFNAMTFIWSALVLVRLRVPDTDPVAELAGATDTGVDDASVGTPVDTGTEPPGATDTGDREPAGAPVGTVVEPAGGFGAELTAGFRTIFGNRELRLIAALMATQTVVAGASLVYEVAIVFELLERGEPTLGLLNSVLGVGGLVGGIVAMVLVQRKRLAGDFGVGVLLWGAPLLLIVAWPSLVTTLIAMLLIGIANSLVDINSSTIVQRVTPPEVMGRVFGAIESIYIFGMAIGALIMPILVNTIGIRAGLAVLGGTVAVVVVVMLPALHRVDVSVLAPPGLELLRQVPMLRVLPPSVLERLARSLVVLEVPAGLDIFREGDRGDRYWVIERGRVSVSTAGEVRRELGPGDGFGEIALLRDVPRTATVTALDDVVLRGLDRDDFIPAVVGHGEAVDAADAAINRFVTLS